MHSIKNKINNKIIDSSTKSTAEKSLIGKITAANEYTNLCDLAYRSYEGDILRASGISVAIGSPSIIDWFPEVGDVVLISEHGGGMTIVGPHIGNYSLDVRGQMELKSDIYPESMLDTLSGYIL